MNSEAYNDYTPSPSRIHSRNARMPKLKKKKKKSVNVIHHINRIKEKNTVISSDAEKALYKNLTHFQGKNTL